MVSVQGSRTPAHSRSSRLRTGLRLIPLLCAAWAGNAAAIDVIYQGPPGSSGLTGAAPGAAGGNGMTAPSAFQVEFSSDLANTMAVTGGKGGDGGNGLTGPGGAGGSGGTGTGPTGHGGDGGNGGHPGGPGGTGGTGNTSSGSDGANG